MEARRGGANLHLLAMGQGVGHEVTIRYFVLLNLLNLLQLGVRIQKKKKKKKEPPSAVESGMVVCELVTHILPRKGQRGNE